MALILVGNRTNISVDRLRKSKNEQIEVYKFFWCPQFFFYVKYKPFD